MIKAGLTSQEALSRQQRFGWNEIVDVKSKYLILRIIYHHLNNLLIYILLVSAIITYLLGHALDTYVIIVVVLLDLIVGFIQEYKANRAVAALKQIIQTTAKVYRDGQLLVLPSRELVVGDVVLLEEGDRVPADGQLFFAKNLRTIESSLTGEAFPVDKNTTPSANSTALADRQDRVWMSTFVAAGVAKFEVLAIAEQTEIGRIAKDLRSIKSEKTHFEIKTELLVKQMSLIAIFGAVLTFLVGYFIRDFTFAEIFTFSVASLVSGIPEGLPAVIIIILAAGASRMAKKKAIVRSLPATETLSVVDIIATDKTGTLTQNTMTVASVQTLKKQFTVSGEGWTPQGDFYDQQKRSVKVADDQQLADLTLAAGLCSRARLSFENNIYQISGDPTDGALLVLSYKAGWQQELEQIEIVDELPFNQIEKFKAVLAEIKNEPQLFVSGAAENIIVRSKLSKAKSEELLEQVRQLSAQAMRVIAIAGKQLAKGTTKINEQEITDLEFLGVVGMIDPPRVGAAAAVAKAQTAGIRVIMKTGDHRDTALAIAKELGIVNEDTPQPQVLTGLELEAMTTAEFKRAVETTAVFARLTPDMKLRILTTLQKQGHTVAMTGDGVNDVLALKKADIGIAMGRIGTDVAREASDIVLADDNFASLVSAVEEGRLIFANTRQASAFLVTTNFAENAIILLSILFGLPLPLIASQILWLNLVTDGVVDVALAAEHSHGDVLTQRPKRKGEGILSRTMLSLLIPLTLTMVASALLVFWWLLPAGIEKARTGAFCVMCFTQLINIFNMRSLDLSIFKIGWLSNKYVVWAVLFSLFLQYIAMSNAWMMNIFKFEYLSWQEVLVIAALSSTVLLVGEAHKFGRRLLTKTE